MGSAARQLGTAKQDEHIGGQVHDWLKAGSSLDEIKEAIFHWLLGMFDAKLRVAITGRQDSDLPSDLRITDVYLAAHPYEEARVTVHGDPRDLIISGSTRICGFAEFGKDKKVTVFHRFIGKTFYQYVYRRDM